MLRILLLKKNILEVHNAHEIDDVAGAYQNIGARARSESARVRQQAEARKGDNK